MAHHLFNNVALWGSKSDNSFYGNEFLPEVEIKCNKKTKYRLVKNMNDEEVQSKMTYLFSSDVDIKAGDKLDGVDVISVELNSGISISYNEVLT